MSTKNQKLSQVLAEFYQRPIAQVSSELIFSIVAVTVFAVFAIRPTLLTMSNLVKEMQDKETLNQALSQKIASLSSAQSEYISNQDKIVILDEAIPPNPRMAEAITIIEKIASENNLFIQNMSATDVPREDSTATVSAEKNRVSKPIIVTVQGDYPTIRKFVTDLQKTRRLFIADSVAFSLTDAQGQKVLKAIITINIQYFGSST